MGGQWPHNTTHITMCIIKFLAQWRKAQFDQGPRFKKKFMLNSAEHEILNAHKFKNTKKFSFFSGSHKPIILFFQLINVKMPTIVGILTFMRRKSFMLS